MSIVGCSATLTLTTQSTTTCETIPTKSTFTLTITSAIPCSHCSGPKYPHPTSTATSAEAGEISSSYPPNESYPTSPIAPASAPTSVASIKLAPYGSYPPESSYGHQAADKGEGAAAQEGSSSLTLGSAAKEHGPAANGTSVTGPGSTAVAGANSTISNVLPVFTGGANTYVGSTWLAVVLALVSFWMFKW